MGRFWRDSGHLLCALAVWMVALVPAPGSRAAVPLEMPIQGVLRDNAGIPVAAGAFGVTFGLWTDETEGVEVWSESWPVPDGDCTLDPTGCLLVTNGVFSIELGSQNPLSSDLFSDHSQLWLAMEIETDPPLPRTRLGTTGYAFFAAWADRLACSGCVGPSELEIGAVGSIEVADESLEASDLAVDVLSSLDGVSNDGGNVDLVAGPNVTITSDDVAKTITISVDVSGKADACGGVGRVYIEGHLWADEEGCVLPKNLLSPDPPPVFGFASEDVTTSESAGGATLTVVRSNATLEGSVSYGTQDGTAEAPGDYSASSGTLGFVVGETSKTLVIPVSDDGLGDPDETFSVVLSDPYGGLLGDESTATVTLTECSQTSLLLHFDGPDGSDSFPDASCQQHVVTGKGGGAQVSTSQWKFGGSSLYLFGSGYVEIPHSSEWNLGSGDFTIDLWVYPQDLGPNTNPLLAHGVYAQAGGWGVIAHNNCCPISLGFVAFNGSGTYLYNFQANKTLVNGTWQHLAMVRQGSTWRYFYNGTVVETHDVGGTSILDKTVALTLGFNPGYPNPTYQGFMDELHITRGEALYTESFTPPTEPYP